MVSTPHGRLATKNHKQGLDKRVNKVSTPHGGLATYTIDSTIAVVTLQFQLHTVD